MRMPHLTKTQRRIYEVLRDGEPHTMEEVLAAMPDPLCEKQNVRNHISIMRKVLRPAGFDILRVLGFQRFKPWVMVRLMSALCPSEI